MRQQCILVYFNKKDKSKASETGNCESGNEASISKPTASVELTLKRAYSDKLNVTEESMKQKGKFVREYNKKILRAWFYYSFV